MPVSVGTGTPGGEVTGVTSIGPKDFPKFINAIIPEAYQITIRLQPMLTDAKNLALHSLKQSHSLFTASVQTADMQQSGAMEKKYTE